MAAWAGMIGQIAGDIMEHNKNTDVKVDGTQTSKKNISQEGIDKIIYDIMSSDSGLAALSSGENGSGGFNSSTKGLMAQDLMVKLAGEIANITAETSTTTNSSTSTDNQTPLAKGIGTIICTHMMNRGFLSRRLWFKGHAYTATLSQRTVEGYQFWAEPIVEHMLKNPNGWMERIWKPIVAGRYELIVNQRFNLLGAITVYVMQPFSYLVGLMIGVPNGRYCTE